MNEKHQAILSILNSQTKPKDLATGMTALDIYTAMEPKEQGLFHNASDVSKSIFFLTDKKKWIEPGALRPAEKNNPRGHVTHIITAVGHAEINKVENPKLIYATGDSEALPLDNQERRYTVMPAHQAGLTPDLTHDPEVAREEIQRLDYTNEYLDLKEMLGIDLHHPEHTVYSYCKQMQENYLVILKYFDAGNAQEVINSSRNHKINLDEWRDRYKALIKHIGVPEHTLEEPYIDRLKQDAVLGRIRARQSQQTTPENGLYLDPTNEIDSGFIKIITALRMAEEIPAAPTIENKTSLIATLETLANSELLAGYHRSKLEYARQILQELPEQQAA